MLFWKRKHTDNQDNYSLQGNSQPSATSASVESSTMQSAQSIEPISPVTILANGDVTIKVGSIVEAKSAIKQLKLHKKKLAVEKKAMSSQISQIRTEYRISSANKGSMVRGGGGIGKFVRVIQRADRDSARLNKECAIAPYEQEKLRLDTLMAKVDSAIIQLERFISENP